MKRRILCLVLTLAMLLPVFTGTVSAAGFRDVASGAYYRDAVDWAVENGITNGTSDTTFSPNLPCTRAQVVTFLWRYFGQEEPQSTYSPFRDVRAGDKNVKHYYEAILWAYENGITSGKTADTFAPNATVTRGEFVTFLWRSAGKPETDGFNPFADVSQKAFYYTPVIWAVEKGITTGMGPATFAPGSTCTRAQVVTFLYRFDQSLNGEEEEPTNPADDPTLPTDAPTEPTDPKPTEPRPTEPKPTEPRPTEPEPTDPGDVAVHIHDLWQEAEPGDLTALPKYNDEPTAENAKAILRVCSPDGYLIFRTDESCAMLFMGQTVTIDLNTVVHETFHDFCHDNHSKAQSHYLGEGRYVLVYETDTYRSQEMAATIPEELRTFRYDTYVGADSDGTSSNESGIYGLINEFNAYWTGMRYTISMFDYYCVQDHSKDAWQEYFSSCENNRQAYAEFRYFMLTYLIYARDHYPEIYRDIMENDELRYAFRIIDHNFRKDIEQYDGHVDMINNGEIPGLTGITVTDSSIRFDMGDGSSSGWMRHTDYFKLMEAMENPVYQRMYELFRAESYEYSEDELPDQPTEPEVPPTEPSGPVYPMEPDAPLPESGNVEVYSHELWQSAVEDDLADLPKYIARPTAEAAKTVLQVCNPDGYLIFRTDESRAMASMGDTLTVGMDTAIYEAFHSFCENNHSSAQSHYLGGGWYVLVSPTETYRSREMGETIPEELRTFRFYSAVGEDSDGKVSNENGIYGLLEEFNGYWMGMRHAVSMFNYYCVQDHSVEAWSEYLSDCDNNRQAYAEFRYYILTYLLYAREHYPEIYQGIIENDELRYAFRVIDDRFSRDIERFDEQLRMMEDGKVPGLCDVEMIEDTVWFRMNNGTSYGVVLHTDYFVLMEAMEDADYQEMYKLLRS